MWRRRLRLGTYFRINVYVHWTFAFLLAYAAYAGFQDGLLGTVYSVVLLCAMFVCVTLHEYGHALTARRFGIETLDITLFPIGGVARLMKIPRIPWQELLVAVAGPAVNVVIVTLILTCLVVIPGTGMPQPGEWLTRDGSETISTALDTPSPLGFALMMVMVNTALVLFNMIPAFPMDGGRVLRSLLAMVCRYRLATRIASTVGVVCAAGMAVAALYWGQPTIGLIALFICYAGLAEARQVEAFETIRGLVVGDVMIHTPTGLPIETTIEELLEHIRGFSTTSVPVVDEWDQVCGMLSIDDVSGAVRNGAGPQTPIGEIARRDIRVLVPEAPLESVVGGVSDGPRQYPVADTSGRLVGLLDLDSLRSRIALHRSGVSTPA